MPEADHFPIHQMELSQGLLLLRLLLLLLSRDLPLMQFVYQVDGVLSSSI